MRWCIVALVLITGCESRFDQCMSDYCRRDCGWYTMWWASGCKEACVHWADTGKRPLFEDAYWPTPLRCEDSWSLFVRGASR